VSQEYEFSPAPSSLRRYASCLLSSLVLIASCLGATYGTIFLFDHIFHKSALEEHVEDVLRTPHVEDVLRTPHVEDVLRTPHVEDVRRTPVPQNVAINTLLTTIREATIRGEGKVVVDAAKKLALRSPERMIELLPNVEALSLRGDHSAAADILALVPEANQGANRWLVLAQKAFKAGSVDVAIRACERVVALKPNKASAHFMLAHIHDRAGRRLAALAHIRRAVQLAPDNRLFQSKLKRIEQHQ